MRVNSENMVKVENERKNRGRWRERESEKSRRATQKHTTQSDVFITDENCLKSAHILKFPLKRQSNNQQKHTGALCHVAITQYRTLANVFIWVVVVAQRVK